MSEKILQSIPSAGKAESLDSAILADVAHALAYSVTPGPPGIPAELARRLELEGMLSPSMRATPGRTVLVELPGGRRTIRSWTHAAEPYARSVLDTFRVVGRTALPDRSAAADLRLRLIKLRAWMLGVQGVELTDADLEALECVIDLIGGKDG